jgi:GT2 family glycosyltransferase
VDDFDGPARFLLPGDEPIDWQPGIKPFVFSRNINVGIRAAGDDDVVLLNDDALLKTPLGFTAIARIAEAHPEYGVIASTCNTVGNPRQWPQRVGLREEPRMICFVCVYIPRRTIEAVGLLDERFTGYGCDDDDFCLRVQKAGLKIGIYDGCFVDHASLRSTFRGTALSAGDYRANLKIFVDKWGASEGARVGKF